MFSLKTILSVLLGLSGLPHAIAAATDDEEAPRNVKVMMVSENPDDADAPKIIKLNTTANWIQQGEDGVMVFQAGNDASGQKRMIKMRTTPHGDIPAGGPWLGVQFGPVPKALTVQLNLPAETGQMILNVAEGSPADVAGFQQYDIITQIDGQPTPAQMSEFLDIVRTFTPNEAHIFTLIRSGQQINTSVTVAPRPAPDAMPKMKYESEIEELSRGRVFGRGGMLEKDDLGNWVFKGFDAQNMPDFFNALPNVSDIDFNIALPGGPGSNSVFRHKTEAEDIRISIDESGQVTVTRTVTENGNEETTTSTYANVEEFKAQSPELYERLHVGKDFRFRYLGSPTGNEDWKQFSLKLNEQVKAGLLDKQRLMEEMQMYMPIPPAPPAGVFLGRPFTRFEVTPEGQIKVTTRSGETELVESFSNVEEMQARKPDLYQKYQQFQERTSRP